MKIRNVITTILFAIFYCVSYGTELVDVRKVIPDIILDIRYATSDNFTGKVLYPSAECFLAEEVAVALRKVQDDLKKQGYRLKIFDGYRPFSVQRMMWNVFPDERYVAGSKKWAVHSKGYAVDVSIVSLDGSSVLMPTDFDEFTAEAHSDYKNLPSDAIKHRDILKKTMMKHGFLPIKTEWWHFNYKGHKDKPVLDIPFDVLKNIRGN